LKSCRNHTNTCLIVDKRHYEINTNGLRLWNNAILRAEATVNVPPLALHPKPTHISKKRKSQAQSGYSSDPEELSASRHKDRWRPNVHAHRPHQKQSGSSYSKPISFDLSSPGSSSPMSANKSLRRPSSSSSSGSVEFAKLADTGSNGLKDYISWQVGRFPEDTGDYFKAAQALEKERYKLKQIESITGGIWKAMGVPMGIGFTLSNDIAEFKKFLVSKGISH
jgi:hypothetical protein